MKKGDHKLFTDKTLLFQVINLRLNGYALTSLARMFNCHHSSIEFQLERYGIQRPETPYTIERIASKVIFHIVPPEPNYERVDGERISKGKSYQDYLKESQFKRLNIRIL